MGASGPSESLHVEAGQDEAGRFAAQPQTEVSGVARCFVHGLTLTVVGCKYVQHLHLNSIRLIYSNSTHIFLYYSVVHVHVHVYGVEIPFVM